MQVMNENTIAEVLECVRRRQLEDGRSPSYREIMRDCRLPSIGRVQRCVRALKARGELYCETDGTIALDMRFGGRSKAVPLVGTIACGGPITAIENLEDVYRFPEELIGRGEHFMLRAKGGSMTGAGIFDGDLLIVRMQQTATGGQIVAALIDGEEATVKTYRPQIGGKIILQAENSDYEDITVNAADCRILGVLAGSFRKY